MHVYLQSSTAPEFVQDILVNWKCISTRLALKKKFFLKCAAHLMQECREQSSVRIEFTGSNSISRKKKLSFFRNMRLLLVTICVLFCSFQFCLSIKIFNKPQELRFVNTKNRTKTEQKQIGKDISTLLSL